MSARFPFSFPLSPFRYTTELIHYIPRRALTKRLGSAHELRDLVDGIEVVVQSAQPLR
ncbi:hypothetical protein PHLCEN_2v6424 [Hermanssonia centrifuga]|uniref:Uncharacterized protein n=1 Tax=Hermanssonia centrifuga TaxID=98765 RepID=A0A2R6NZG4_9APHY|nr:hypothetical protein PHLCEN_2v6424 [Hermanssonia centrifuga]